MSRQNLEPSGRARAPRFKPPQRQARHLSRPRLVEAIDSRLEDTGSLIVSAPSGYGKTTVVSEWAERHPGRVAWVTLGPLDVSPTRLGMTVLAALQGLARSWGTDDLEEIAQIDVSEMAPQEAIDAIISALAALDEPIYLVVDDAQLASPNTGPGILSALTQANLDALRTVLVGKPPVEAAFSRLLLSSPTAAVRADELAFDLQELEASAVPEAAGASAHKILGETGGWPLAVRMVQLTGLRPEKGGLGSDSLLQEYVRTELLGEVSEQIRHLALTTSVAGDLTVPLAAALTGSAEVGQLLEQCVREGLFIDRFETPKGPVYRWHDLFAKSCRWILAAQDPEAIAKAYEIAAAFVEESQPLLAADCWLSAGNPEKAVEVAVRNWATSVVGPDAHALDHWCASLPQPYADDPRVLLVRACANDVEGLRDMARLLAGHAHALAEKHKPDGYDDVVDQANVLLLDDRDQLAAASSTLRDRLEEMEPMTAHNRAALLFLLGFAEMRHRRSPRLMLEHLKAAYNLADAVGEATLAARARTHLAFALAWFGDFQQAEKLLVDPPQQADVEAWVSYAGGGGACASGLMAYWRGDLKTAQSEFMRSIRGGSSELGFAGISRMMLTFVAATTKDPKAYERAIRELALLPRRPERGVSWPAFRLASLAALHEAAGQKEQAMAVARQIGKQAGEVPWAGLELAGIAVRGGDLETAVSITRNMLPYH